MIRAHPLAELFPMLGDADAASLAADIGSNGMHDRIVILDGKILDGRNRHRAAIVCGLLTGDLPPEGDGLWMTHYRRFLPAQDGDPLAWVLSKNLHRRHLDESQRAMVAARLANMSVGRPEDSRINSANLPNLSQGRAAEMLHVSPRSVGAAKSVVEHGAPGLAERVESGEISVSVAAEASKLSVGEQLRILREQNPREFSRHVRLERQKPRAVMNTRVQPPDDLDYSPTPPWATRCLTQIVLPHLGQSLAGRTVREPACGEGHISAVLQESRPLQLWASDIFDYSVDGVSPPAWLGTRDYLDPEENFGGADWVITNPPFAAKGEAFAMRALEEAAVGVAMFLRLGWLASNGRYNRLFSINPPTLLAIFAEDVPLHMGRWEPEGSTLSDYMWLVWIKGEAPRAPFWIPPGQRVAMAKPDDVARFTANPVVGLAEANNDAAAASAAIAHTFESATPILMARYANEAGDVLAAELGRPIGTIRTWAHRLGLTSKARIAARGAAMVENFNKEKAQ